MLGPWTCKRKGMRCPVRRFSIVLGRKILIVIVETCLLVDSRETQIVVLDERWVKTIEIQQVS
jgi:hypothetical protein